jgi:LacI family gluconate utilization system Gnt-I transcriptional repressor
MARQRTTSGKIRLTEVAKLAGVSPITASRFFRNPAALSASKRERVESAAKELGYVPDPQHVHLHRNAPKSSVY